MTERGTNGQTDGYIEIVVQMGWEQILVLLEKQTSSHSPAMYLTMKKFTKDVTTEVVEFSQERSRHIHVK